MDLTSSNNSFERWLPDDIYEKVLGKVLKLREKRKGKREKRKGKKEKRKEKR